MSSDIDIRELYPPEEELDALVADVDVHGEHDRAMAIAESALSWMEPLPRLPRHTPYRDEITTKVQLHDPDW